MFDERIKLTVAVGFLVAGVLGQCVSRIKGIHPLYTGMMFIDMWIYEHAP